MPTRVAPLVFAACALLLAGSCTAPPPPAPSVQQNPSAAAESIGSTRNARIAIPMPSGPVPVTFLAGDLTAEQRDELARIAPNVRVLTNLSREGALRAAPTVQGIDGRYATPEFLEHAPSLVWVQSTSAGVERYLAIKPLADQDRIVLTNMRAAHGPAIADHAFAMLLTLTRRLRFYADRQARADWTDQEPEPRPIALQGRVMLVVGLGGIGTEVAQRARGFGMRIHAIRRTDSPAPDSVERLGKPEDLLSMLPGADVVAICLPLTPETRHLFDARAIGAMKPGAYLINVARGPIVDTGALVAALRSGRLAGACLDVTDPEPLPPDHPLWKLPNVVITPHVSADAELTRQRAWLLLRENIRRFGAGEPLLNVVDKHAGY
jgi:phosphoglycerate dehydrogenase-like enzyme